MSTRILLFIVLRLHWSFLDLVHENEQWVQLAEALPFAAAEATATADASVAVEDAGLSA